MNALKCKEGECAQSRSVHLYADEELDASHVLEVEEHMEACTRCREELATIRAFRRSLKSSTARKAPRAFRSRLEGCLASPAVAASLDLSVSHVAARAPAADADVPRVSRRVRWLGYAAACVAAAASFVIAIWFQKQKEENRTAQTSDVGPVRSSLLRAIESAIPANDAARVEPLDTMLDQLVSLHAHPLPPEIKSQDQLDTFEPYVGVPVRRPSFRIDGGASRLVVADGAEFPKPGFPKPKTDPGASKLKFVGARLHALQDMQRAALLTYTIDGHRITVYVFDPRSVPIRKTRLRQTVVRERPVYVGSLRGYSVAAAEKSGVGYALASDFDDIESAKMVANF
jgi:hypothetical protein